MAALAKKEKLEASIAEGRAKEEEARRSAAEERKRAKRAAEAGDLAGSSGNTVWRRGGARGVAMLGLGFVKYQNCHLLLIGVHQGYGFRPLWDSVL